MLFFCLPFQFVFVATSVTSPNATLRRSSSTLSQGQKPAPPVRRNSSIQSITTDVTSTSHSSSNNDLIGSSTLPSNSAAKDDSFELPPPPPPDELARDLVNATAATYITTPRNSVATNSQNVSQITQKYETVKAASASSNTESVCNGECTTGSSVQRQSSIANKHGQIINTLNAKLLRPTSAPKNRSPTAVQPRPQSQRHHAPPPAVADKPRMTSVHRDDDVTPTADAPASASILAQIQHGVHLRKTSACELRNARP